MGPMAWASLLEAPASARCRLAQAGESESAPPRPKESCCAGDCVVLSWRLHVTASSEAAASKVASRVNALLDGRLAVETIEPYWKVEGQHVVSCSLRFARRGSPTPWLRCCSSRATSLTAGRSPGLRSFRITGPLRAGRPRASVLRASTSRLGPSRRGRTCSNSRLLWRTSGTRVGYCVQAKARAGPGERSPRPATLGRMTAVHRVAIVVAPRPRGRSADHGR